MSTLTVQIKIRIASYGGVRKTAKALGISPSYLIRLRDGTKENPSKQLLDKLGLERKIEFKRKRGN